MSDNECDQINSNDVNIDAMHSEETDGGRAGWIVVLTMWMRGIIRAGVLKGLGMMLPILQDQFATTTWVIGWMISLILAMGGLVAPLAGFLGRRFGAGAVIMVCGTMIGIAFIAGSFASNEYQLTLMLMLLAGSALRVPLVLTKDAVGRCFSKNHALATGIARTGDSIGLIVYAPLIQLFINTYGWRGAMLLIGGISMHIVPCGALMTTIKIPPTNNYQELPRYEPSFVVHQSTVVSCYGAFWKSVFKNFDLALLCNFRYWSVATVYFCSNFVFDMWVIYFVSQAQLVGFSLEEAAVFVTVAGVGNLIAKVAQGFIVDRGIISSLSLMIIAAIVSSASVCATPWMTSYWAMMLSAPLVLSCTGVMSCLHDIITKQVLGVQLLAGAYGWMEIKVAILRITLGFLPGLMYDTTGSYHAAFIFIGCIQFSQVIPLVGLKYFRCVN